MALSRTARYYRNNPEAREKRLEYQKEYNKKKRNVKYRVGLNRFNRNNGTKGDGLDACHRESKSGKIMMVLCAMKKNRSNKKQRKQQSNG